MHQKLQELKNKSLSYKNNFASCDWIPIKRIVSELCEPFDALKTATRCAENATPGSKYFGKTVDEIIKDWNNYGQKRIVEGMTLDTYIQVLFSGVAFTEESATIDQRKIFRQFDDLKKHIIDATHIINDTEQKMEFIGTEVWLSSHIGIRGKMDALFWLNDGYFIFDWKNFKTQDPGYNNMLGPLSYLKDSSINKASLQLYLYKYIIEEDYEWKTSGVRIGLINENCWQVIRPTFAYDTRLMNEIIDFAKNRIRNK